MSPASEICYLLHILTKTLFVATLWTMKIHTSEMMVSGILSKNLTSFAGTLPDKGTMAKSYTSDFISVEIFLGMSLVLNPFLLFEVVW